MTDADDANATSLLQSEAWAAWNDSYHEPNGEAFRALGRVLYVQDMHERIKAQLARLDEQNALLDAILSRRAAESALPVM